MQRASRRVRLCRCQVQHGGRRECSHGTEQALGVEHGEGDAVQRLKAIAVQVNLSLSCVVHGHTVETDRGVGTPHSPHADGFQSSRAAVVSQVHAGESPQCIPGVRDALSQQVLRRDFLERCGSLHLLRVTVGHDDGCAQRIDGHR